MFGRIVSPRLWQHVAGSSQSVAIGAAASAVLAALVKAHRVNDNLSGCELKTRVTDDLSHRLYADEQRTVALFHNSSVSVVHIVVSGAPPGFSPGLYNFDSRQVPLGSGTGCIWDQRHIVTNFHVIQKARGGALVTLSDHTCYNAELVGVDPDKDLAVLRIKGADGATKPLLPLQRGSSSNLQVGQKVFAIGNPFGFDQTLTSGLVSGIGRQIPSVTGKPIRGLIQTDAAINPGNSGGPLLDARGKLIGINTMIHSPSGASAGIGFAIPVDTVVRVVERILAGRRPAFLGVHCLPNHVSRQISNVFVDQGGPSVEGVLISEVEPYSPADNWVKPLIRTAGGVCGDEILAINGRETPTVEKLLDEVEALSAGDEVELLCRRRQGESAKLVRIPVRLAAPRPYGLLESRNKSPSHGQAITDCNDDSPRRTKRTAADY